MVDRDIAVGENSLSQYLSDHRLRELFIENLGWERDSGKFEILLEGEQYEFTRIANKRGFAVVTSVVHRTVLANRGLLRRLQRKITHRHHEHIAIFVSIEPRKQVWQWSTRLADGRRFRHREHPFFSDEPPATLLRRLEQLHFSLDEEESATLIDAVTRVRNALDVTSDQNLFARLPSYTKQSDALAVRIQSGDTVAFDEFIWFHRRLARKASRMLIRWVGLEPEDAEQVAVMGMIEAARRFDPTKGYQFSTYANYWIRSQCQRFGVVEGMLIRFPVSIFWSAYKFEYRYHELLATHGPWLPDEIVHEALARHGLKRQYWNTFLEAKRALRFSDLDRREFEDVRSITTTDVPMVENLVEEEIRQAILSEMKELRPRDCQVIGARYGLVRDEITLQECAEELGITRERVRQIQMRGEKELKIRLRRNYPSLFDDEELGGSRPSEASKYAEDLELDVEECRPSQIDIETPAAGHCESLMPESSMLEHDVLRECTSATLDRNSKPSDTTSRTDEVDTRMTQWVFAELAGAAVRRDPNETELFKTEDAGENEYAGTDALVREVIQNSMDAGNDDGSVRVRFALHSSSEQPPDRRLSDYFGRLKPALQHRDVNFNGRNVPELDLGFLVCEDFGTRGLGGNVALATDPTPGHTSQEDFFWFWRNIGRSGKTGDDLGRWGLGKTVYRAASRVGCMLGLTVRQQDGDQYLMGQSVLRLHKHGDKEYAPEGFWCSGCDEHGLPIPIDADYEIESFSNEWRLTRTTEPGLSVVVPYVTDYLQAESILRLAAINFFVPIIKGDLVVEIAGTGLPGGVSEIRVDSDSIDGVCEQLAWNGKVTQKQSCPPPISLARRSLAAIESATPTNLLGTSTMPVIDDRTFDSDTTETLRKRFADQEVLGIRVRSALPKRCGGAEEGELTVFLQRSSGTDRYESYFVREGMTITRLNSKRSLRGVKSLVLVEPGPLASLLGDTEGPSHTSWDTSNDERANQTWKTWKGRVKFYTRIIDALVELLSPPPDEADFDLLSDFFSIDHVTSPKPRRKPGEKGTSNQPFVRPEPTPRWYRSAGKEGGFRISKSPALAVPKDAVLRVSVAYDMAGGNPLRNWSRFDFDFRQKVDNPIKFTGKSVKPVLRGGNVIDVAISDETFELTAVGFDVHRDLFIRIDEIDSTEESDEI